MNAPLIHPLPAASLPWRDGGGHHLALTRRARRLSDAIDTMMRGTAFLHARAAMIEQRGTSSVPRHAMVLANALRELDCFLHVLLDELAASAGVRGPELHALRRRRNAARKLSAYPALFGGQAQDQDRLIALSAQKAVLLRIFAGRRPSHASRVLAPVTQLPAIDLRTISSYYADLSARLITRVERLRDAGHLPLRCGPIGPIDQAALPAPVLSAARL